MSTDIWVVLVEDRHSDVDARPFSSEERAAEYARSQVDDTDLPAELNDAMRKDGWALYIPYGTEGDCVRVVRRTLDGER